VFDRECAHLVRETQIAQHKVEHLQREIVEKDDVAARLHGDLQAANQALQEAEKECSHTRSQLDSELEAKEQLQQR